METMNQMRIATKFPLMETLEFSGILVCYRMWERILPSSEVQEELDKKNQEFAEAEADHCITMNR